MRVSIWSCVIFVVLGLFLAAFYTQSRAQITQVGRISATGGAGFGFSGEVGSLLANPAGMATMKGQGLLLAHHYSHHQPDVSAQALLFARPVSMLHLGASYVQYTLPEAYYDRLLGAYLGRSFGPELRIAIGLQFHALKIPAHLEEHRFQILMGIQYDWTADFTMGLVFGPIPLSHSLYTPSVIRSDTERRVMRIGVGSQYWLGDQVLLRLDQRFFPFNTHAGMEYQLVPDTFTLRMGLSTLGLQPAAGVGFSRSWWSIDVSGVFHQRLGWSPQLDLGVNW